MSWPILKIDKKIKIHGVQDLANYDISQFMIHIKIINTKIQLNENKNIIKINDTKNDEFSDCVYENIKRKFALKNYEKVYDKMYEKYI